MTPNDFKPILKALQKYYPLGLPETEGGFDDIQKVISEKLSSKHHLMENWFKFIEELKVITSYHVEDTYYFQFPNLKVIIEQKVCLEGITVDKRFIICISLLCPFFSYFYEYTHWVKLPTGGSLGLSGTYFLKSENYDNLKIDLDLANVEKLITKYFPEYSFLYHFSLMTKEISGGYPVGDVFQGKLDRKYNIYQYLFDNIYHRNAIDL